MKVSEVNKAVIRDYLRVDDDAGQMLDVLQDSAVSFIRAYTGLTDEQMDKYDDLAVAMLVLCADMYDNRQMAVLTDKLNPVIERILSAHSVNLL